MTQKINWLYFPPGKAEIDIRLKTASQTAVDAVLRDKEVNSNSVEPDITITQLNIALFVYDGGKGIKWPDL